MRERIGSYRLEHELGTTGMCIEYEAMHVVLPRRAIIKVTHDEIGWVRPIQVQVLREACILEALQHPGIVRVYEAGVLDDRRPWFAYEHVPGDLLDVALARGAMAIGTAVRLVRDLADILAHAHRRGVVHAGLRPDRIVLTPRTRATSACVFDWSEARTHDATGQLPPVPGEPMYVAPEVARGDSIDDRADVYALGVIAHQALAGAPPGEAERLADRCEAPPEVCALVEQMLAPDRWDRPASGEIYADLALLAGVVAPPYLRKPRWTPADALVKKREAGAGPQPGTAAPGRPTNA